MSKRLKMKGLALNVVWGLIIAIASVLVFLSLITGTFKNAANWFYCDVYIKVISFFTNSEIASVPDTCRPTIKDHAKVETVDDTDNKIFSRKLLAYIIACWGEAEIKGIFESHPCYELRLSEHVENVSEGNVTQILIKEDHCKSIENSDYGCGAKNQIVWSIDGEVLSLTEQNVLDEINLFTVPNQIPGINIGMIPSVAGIKETIQLKGFLAKDVPTSICGAITCDSWNYNRSTDLVLFNISSNIYNYSIDSIMSDMEIKGFTNSTINYQKILLVEYNGPKDAIEVIG